MGKLFSETDAELQIYREKIQRLNAEAAARFHDPVWRQEKAQQIGSAIYKGFEHENLVDLFTEVERLPLDGRSYIEEVRGMEVFHIARGGYIEESYVHSEVMEIPRDQLGFHVKEMEDKLEVGFAETADKLVELGIKRLDAAVNQRVLSTFQAAVGPGSDYYVNAASGLSLENIDDAIAEVEDTTISGEITIVGRATMTRKIVNLIKQGNSFGGFLPETNEELLRRGKLGTYAGVPIVTLRNFLDGNDKPFFPANELWVIGKDAGKTAFFGGTKVKQFLEDDNWYWHYLQRMDYGVAVVRPSHTRRIVDATVAA